MNIAITSKLRSQRGQTMTETAIVLPVFCLLLFGVIQMGILWNNYVTLTDAVRVGARKASVSRGYADPAAETEAAVRNAARDLRQDAEYRLDVTVTSPSSPWRRGEDVTVTGQYDWKLDLLGFVLASGKLRSTTTTRLE
jgi:Flp pilus assembly protein TadG